MLQHRAGAQRMARGGVSGRRDASDSTAGWPWRKCAPEPLGPQVSWAKDGSAGEAHRKMQRKGRGTCDDSELGRLYAAALLTATIREQHLRPAS